jgi:hypothetical protein
MALTFETGKAADAPKIKQANGNTAEMAEYDKAVAGVTPGTYIRMAVPTGADGKQPSRSLALKLSKATTRVGIKAEFKVYDGKDGFVYAVRSNGAKASA